MSERTELPVREERLTRATAFIRKAIDSAAAARLGTRAFCFLVALATEEGFSSTGPLRLYDLQLMRMTGLRTMKEFEAVRKDCIADGWLEYAPPERAGWAGEYRLHHSSSPDTPTVS